MGTGKTFIAAAAYMAGFKRILVFGPPHLVPKWKREVEMTVPGARAVIERWAVSRGRLVRDEETGEPFRVPCCPGCTAQVVDKDGVPLTDEDLNRRKRTCAGCGSPIWQADRSGPARPATRWPAT